MKSIRRLKSKRWSVFLMIISFAFLCCLASDKPAKADINVSGIIGSNTTWTLANSPYVITDTVQIPAGVTLTIEPGVTITKQGGGYMFLLNGNIYAHGSLENKIVFDGDNSSSFFNSDHSSGETFLDLEYCIIRNGESFWRGAVSGGHGHFSLKKSLIDNLSNYSYVWYPYQDVHIEYNEFRNSAGFSIGHGAGGGGGAGEGVRVYIRYNLFNGWNENLTSDVDFYIKNWANYDQSQTIVEYNSFINTEGVVLKLPGGYSPTGIIARNNYWGTQDTSIIDSMIYDQKDDITVEGYIDYLPILASSDPNTPPLTVSVPRTCTSWTYLEWSSCSVNRQQTRTVISSSPLGCSGGSPILTQSCAYTAPTCVSWIYSDWGYCISGKQTRTIESSQPGICIGGTPILSQSCYSGTPNVPANPSSTAPDITNTTATATPVASVSEIKTAEILAFVQDGDIIQCKNSADPFAVYIVKEVKGKKYIRHIVNLNIFNHYKHLQWGNLKQIDSLTGFSLSGWVRVNTGPNGSAGPNDKVYEINGDQTKHWINMTAQQFLTHGGSEEAIYSINQGESDLYTIGANVSSL